MSRSRQDVGTICRADDFRSGQLWAGEKKWLHGNVPRAAISWVEVQ